MKLTQNAFPYRLF